MKFALVVFEICELTDRHTDMHADGNTSLRYSGSEVKIVSNAVS